jgi:tetratricopeptide (TPR) repeat protein
MAGSEVETSQAPDAEAGICTETLARLYLQQGFVERALAIYRRLAQEQPDNPQFHERLHTLEQQLTLGTLGPDTVVPRTAPDLAMDTTSRALRRQREAVIAQLERWLHYLQRQRQRQDGP